MMSNTCWDLIVEWNINEFHKYGLCHERASRVQYVTPWRITLERKGFRDYVDMRLYSWEWLKMN